MTWMTRTDPGRCSDEVLVAEVATSSCRRAACLRIIAVQWCCAHDGRASRGTGVELVVSP